ncbi:uncharacterized protein VTP21DRAFT_8962 [Calcarisporiella thermophila]|uniref:uncharacterized protein n=1 Tax=Calcarisporiella thermophila TaxID=911321 RepID=UPI003743D4EA
MNTQIIASIDLERDGWRGYNFILSSYSSYLADTLIPGELFDARRKELDSVLVEKYNVAEWPRYVAILAYGIVITVVSVSFSFAKWYVSLPILLFFLPSLGIFTYFHRRRCIKVYEHQFIPALLLLLKRFNQEDTPKHQISWCMERSGSGPPSSKEKKRKNLTVKLVYSSPTLTTFAPTTAYPPHFSVAPPNIVSEPGPTPSAPSVEVADLPPNYLIDEHCYSSIHLILLLLQTISPSFLHSLSLLLRFFLSIFSPISFLCINRGRQERSIETCNSIPRKIRGGWQSTRDGGEMGIRDKYF